MKFTKETARRALRTFLQTAIAYIAVNVCVIDWGAEKAALKSAVIGLIVSAGAAGIAAVMNLEHSHQTDEVEEQEIEEEVEQ